MATSSNGIISGSMSQSTDPNAATTSTAASTNPATATTASPTAPTSGNNVTSTPNTGSAVNYKSQLDSAAPSASTPSATSTASTAAPAANASAANWYSSDLGRTPDASGLAYWDSRLSAPGADASAIKNEFLDDAAANKESLSSGASSQLASQDQSAALKQENAQLQNNVSNAQSAAAPKAATYTANTLGSPTQLNVGAQQTVQGQIANILDPNSAIIQQARTGALQQANANGLLNSTMAIGAADSAAYSAALPIAQQDATTYNTDAATNAASANKFAEDNQAAVNTAGQFNANGQNTLTGQQIGANTSITNANTAANTSLATNAASNASSQAIASGNNASQQQIATGNNQSAQTIASGNNASQQQIASGNNATTTATNSATNATNVQIAQLNASNTSNIQAASNVNQAASAYQSALNNIAQLNMDAESKYQAQLTAFNAYKNAVSLLDQHLGVPDLSGQLQFNQVDPGTGAPATENAA